MRKRSSLMVVRLCPLFLAKSCLQFRELHLKVPLNPGKFSNAILSFGHYGVLSGHFLPDRVESAVALVLK
jgi:hypothetical protein